MDSPLYRLLVAFSAGLLGWLFAVPSFAGNQSQSIGVLYSSTSPTQSRVATEVARTVERFLNKSDFSASLHLHDIDKSGNGEINYSLTVSIGLNTALHFKEMTPLPHRVVYGLVSKSNLDQLTRNRSINNDRVYGVYLDQPLKRLFLLAKAAFPKATSLGMVLSNESPWSSDEVSEIATTLGLQAYTQSIEEQEDLISALENVMENSQVLIALPDPLIFNRYTVQKILLTTYRKQIPVVAFSSALARAGATVAVYSTPRQIGRDLGEMTIRILNGTLPSSEYITGPKYFSVVVNQQVTRSLGFHVPDEDELHRLLEE